ncbi:hypothetical protein IW256_006133 [Actinomadura viridis]|uniref:Uncharacterized protein n=1 Tax=Actinomadura viridis TaxID=58110 RepID=A0A931DL57_9ACTN|nr:hypothetical protein [Actinomadura viridis]
MHRLTAHHPVVPDHASGVVEEAHIRAALWQSSPGTAVIFARPPNK